jgi:hypothetical protein
MTREAVETGLFEAIDGMIDVAREEFDPVRALRGSRGGPGAATVNRLVKRNRLLDRHVVRPELRRYRDRARRQVSAMLDAIEAGEPVDSRREALLEASVYYAELDPGVDPATREAVAEAVLERFRGAGEAVAPLVRSPEEEFWAAMTAELEKPAARALIEANFGFAERMREFRDAYAFETRLDPADLLGGLGRALPAVSVEYTDESLRAMSRAERAVRERYSREIGRRYAD